MGSDTPFGKGFDFLTGLTGLKASPPPPIAPPPAMPSPMVLPGQPGAETETQKKQDKAAEEQTRARGRASTILSGIAGDTSKAETNRPSRSLLGF